MSDTAVQIHPLIVDLQPYFVAAAATIIPAVAAWVAAILQRKAHIEISKATLDIFDQAAETQAGKWYAAAAAGAANVQLDAHNPAIALAANTVIARLPAEASAIGMTPEKLQDMIAGKIGKLQATASSVPPT